MNDSKKKYLLFEDVDPNKVIDAIKRRKEVRATYQSDENSNGTGERIIQPVAYGLSKANQPVVRAFQPFGDTKTKVPHWKLFRLDRFTNWKTLNNRTFNQPPDIQYGNQGRYNTAGDSGMTEIYIKADFEGASKRYEKGGLKRHNEKVHNEKVAQNPYYDLEKQTKKQNKIMVGPEAMKYVNQWKANSDMQKYLNGASAEEMSISSKFGDENFTQTSGPVIKGETEQENPIVKSPNIQQSYNNVAMNGPIIKGIEKDKEENEINKDEEVNNQ